MQLLKLTEEQIRNICSPINLQRAENYISRFYDCEMDNTTIKGRVRGNHGIYEVELTIDTDPLKYKCDCKTSKTVFCKHAAALGLTYIYTPWVFVPDMHLEKDEIKTLEELDLYLRKSKLKSLIEDLKEKNISISTLSELTGISVQQISSVIREDLLNKYHILTNPLKIVCLYLMEKDFK